MLSFNQVTKFHGPQRILDNLSFSISPGEIYGLLGPNGAGKTTTINLICHLLQPNEGHITLLGQRISDQTKLLIGVAPQENLLYRSLTVEENLAFFGRLYGLKTQERRRRIEWCLGAVNLMAQRRQTVSALSGGMQRRLNLAIALIHSPKLLILDEPTTGLDLEARYDLWELIQTLQGDGMTILLTTHFLEEAQRLCHRIGILKQGQLLAQGTLDELRRLIPAQEIVLLRTPNETQAIAKVQALGWTHRYYGPELALWLPTSLDLRSVLDALAPLVIDAITIHPVGLEHIYLEVTQSSLTP